MEERVFIQNGVSQNLECVYDVKINTFKVAFTTFGMTKPL